MNRADIVAALGPLVDALERLGIPYSVAGSVASSAHGIARATLDVDVVADLKPHHAERVVAALERDYYIELGSVRDAIERRAMFNVVHLDTMLKVDAYLLTEREFDRSSFSRRAQGRLGDDEDARPFFIDSPEDSVLHKLEWYRAGGEVSERQWGDIVGVLRVQGDALDGSYLERWAAGLGVSDLLARARVEASGKPS